MDAIIFLILQAEKLRPREIKSLDLVPRFVFLITTLYCPLVNSLSSMSDRTLKNTELGKRRNVTEYRVV